jgi:S1-C subfamily serine protease
VVQQVSPQVVQIQTTQGLGSGIVYDGHAPLRWITARSVRGSVPTSLAWSWLPPGRPARQRSPTPPACSPGDIVFAIGNPLGLQSSVTQGIVSSINRSVSEGTGVTLSNVIQTSAEINPGNSGGALVDLRGTVVGIPTLAALDPEFGNNQAAGIGFAIRSEDVRRVADTLIACEQ